QRTLWRKMQEAVLALWLERKFSKTEILELYLNRVYFGSGAYGVEAAAQKYFGKPAREVKIAEAAMLAGMGENPSRPPPTPEPHSKGGRAPRPGGARGHARARLRARDDGQGGAGAAGACGETRRRLRQLRRRLDHGRARRPRRPGRPGSRGRELDRSRAAGRG